MENHIEGNTTVGQKDWLLERSGEPVQLFSLRLCDIFRSDVPLHIPEFQRIYCWEEKNVRKLLEDIFNIRHGNPYHLGNIIIQFKEDRFDIIDGQQRLVTLALILSELGKNDIPLLEQSFNSNEAKSYVAYNKYIIRNFIEKFIEEKDRTQSIDSLLDKLMFSVLVLNDKSLELAYTFFSNQNSRGKSLTDYELLKSHHLRFISSEEQAKHLAMKWDNMLLNYEDDEGERNVSRTLETYLFRLRKWMRKNEWFDNEQYKVKTEFEAAPIIAEIPPFGERFVFNEAIQGGSHFFAYVDHFIFRFETFKNTATYKATLILNGETHSWYRDVIQAFLFAYYLKFDNLYLEEALVSISKIVSRHRYENGRTNFHQLMKYAGDCELVLMLDRATSPTFFLADCVEKIKLFPKLQTTELTGIRARFFELEKRMFAYDEVANLIKNNGFVEFYMRGE